MSKTHEIPKHRPIMHVYERFITKQLPLVADQMPCMVDENGKPERDDVPAATHKGYRQFGAFLMKPSISPISMADTAGDAILEQEEPYISLHLRTLEPEEATIDYIRESLRDVADHFRTAEDILARKVAGITYARLGQTASQAFGFQVAELPIMHDPLEDPTVRPVLVYADIDELVERY
jgi:hypothetical protein